VIFSLRVSQAILISNPASKSFKATNQFEHSTRYCSLSHVLFNFSRKKTLNMKSVQSLFIHCQSLPNFCRHHIVVSIAICCPERSDIKYNRTPSPTYPSKYDQIVCKSFYQKVNVTIYGNIILLSVRFFDMAKFTNLTPLLY
jgi:hypothetical protein